MSDTPIKNVNINGTEYAIDDLSDTVKIQISNLQIIDQKIAHAQQEVLIFQTARAGISNALNAELAKDK